MSNKVDIIAMSINMKTQLFSFIIKLKKKNMVLKYRVLMIKLINCDFNMVNKYSYQEIKGEL